LLRLGLRPTLSHIMGRESTDAPGAVDGPLFATTHWSVVLAAANQESPEAAAALERLCRTYWYPLYVFIRRQGYGVADAQDLTQAFFTHILSRRFFQRASRDKGKFRSFILGSLKFFLADELAKLQAKKRGGGQTFVFLDEHSAEERYRLEPVELMDAEKLFERRWAMTLLDRVLERLEAEFVDSGKKRLFERLRDFLLGDRGSATYQDVAPTLAMTEGAVKTAVHRMRQRYRELFREEIAETCADPAEADDEMRHVFAAISR
jgi:DNA-directed RNA polymerase specialized sigma24 family protein